MPYESDRNMSHEESIKAKHILEASLRQYLRYINMSTNEEIELAMARLADTLKYSSSSNQQLHLNIKGQILFTYLELRQKNQLPQKKLKRLLVKSEMNKFFMGKGMEEYQAELASYKLKLNEENIRLENELKKYRIQREKINEEFNKLGFIERIFTPRGYLKPPTRNNIRLPQEQKFYINKNLKNGKKSDFFIELMYRFQLVNIDSLIDTLESRNIIDLSSD